jgi:hypothetical protein
VSQGNSDAGQAGALSRTGVGPSPAAIVALLVTNLIPLIGVLFWGWSLFAILLLYWIENGIVGAINVLKIARAEAAEPEVTSAPGPRRQLMMPRYAVVPFFLFHYGLFWLVHGVFVFAFFGFGLFAEPDAAAGISSPGLLVAGVALAVSHFLSYRTNYIGRGEYRRVSPSAQMMSVYGRVVVLHLTILFGGAAISFLGHPAAAMAVMVIVKTAIDLGLHLREHGALRPARQASV